MGISVDITECGYCRYGPRKHSSAPSDVGVPLRFVVQLKTKVSGAARWPSANTSRIPRLVVVLDTYSICRSPAYAMAAVTAGKSAGTPRCRPSAQPTPSNQKKGPRPLCETRIRWRHEGRGTTQHTCMKFRFVRGGARANVDLRREGVAGADAADQRGSAHRSAPATAPSPRCRSSGTAIRSSTHRRAVPPAGSPSADGPSCSRRRRGW